MLSLSRAWACAGACGNRKRISGLSRKRAMTLPIACAQLACTLFEPRQNLEKADHYIREATRQGARLIVLPEFLTSGCTYDHRMCEYAEEIGGPTTKWMVRHSTERRCWIAAGM